MAFRAMFKTPDAFFRVSRSHICTSVPVTAVAGITGIRVGIHVARVTTRRMIRIEPKIRVVVECGVAPANGSMTRTALLVRFLVQAVDRLLGIVARRAVGFHRAS